jgi:hypothetical protein
MDYIYIQHNEGADQSGSTVLEHLLMVQDNTVKGLENVGLKELVCVTSWYLW